MGNTAMDQMLFMYLNTGVLFSNIYYFYNIWILQWLIFTHIFAFSNKKICFINQLINKFYFPKCLLIRKQQFWTMSFVKKKLNSRLFLKEMFSLLWDFFKSLRIRPYLCLENDSGFILMIINFCMFYYFQLTHWLHCQKNKQTNSNSDSFIRRCIFGMFEFLPCYRNLNKLYNLKALNLSVCHVY